MRKLFIASIVALSINASYGGVNGYTAHSRANCVTNNESISWYLGNAFKGMVSATHWYKGVAQHSVTTGWQTSWRIGVVHWGESDPRTSDWAVRSWHYSPYRNDTIDAVDCYIYDGWWCDGNWCK